MSAGRSRACAALLALALGFAAWAFLGFPLTGVDDANITFTYARNLAAGHGFVFTPGFERVEGFTSLLWTLLCAAFFLSSDAPEPWLLGVCALLTSFCGVATVEIARLAVIGSQGDAPTARAWDRFATASALLWLIGLPGFFAWMVAPLMDVTLFAALVHGFAWAGARLVLAAPERSPSNEAWLAVASAALVLTRPEALALVPGGLAMLWFCVRLRGSAAGPALRSVAVPSLAFAATAIGLTAFRWSVFGFPFPNTYYAKVSPDRWYSALAGIEYIAAWWRYQPGSLALCLAAAATLGWGAWKRSASVAVFVAGWALGGLALPLVGGGDHFGSFRFLQPFAPLWIVPALALSARLGSAQLGRRSAIAALAILVALAGLALQRFSERHHLRGEFQAAFATRALGESLGEAFRSGKPPSIGTVVVGGIAFRYPGRVVDLMGLNWVAMGHSSGDRKGSRNHAAFDPDVFWRSPPDVVTPRFLRGRDDGCAFETEFENRVLLGLHDSPRFAREYAAAKIDLGNRVVGGYVRKAWAEREVPPGLVFFEGAKAHCDTDWEQDPKRRAMRGRGWRPIWLD